MVNIPIKEKLETYTQTFDKPHENSCPIDLRPKQESYSNCTEIMTLQKITRIVFFALIF